MAASGCSYSFEAALRRCPLPEFARRALARNFVAAALLVVDTTVAYRHLPRSCGVAVRA